MTEKQSIYQTQITAAKMYDRVNLLAKEKLKENSHKCDFLSQNAYELFEDFNVEVAEFKKAFRIYERDPTIRNKNELDREAGDVFNNLSAIVAKTDGINSLNRG